MQGAAPLCHAHLGSLNLTEPQKWSLRANAAWRDGSLLAATCGILRIWGAAWQPLAAHRILLVGKVVRASGGQDHSRQSVRPSSRVQLEWSWLAVCHMHPAEQPGGVAQNRLWKQPTLQLNSASSEAGRRGCLVYTPQSDGEAVRGPRLKPATLAGTKIQRGTSCYREWQQAGRFGGSVVSWG